MAPRPKKQTLYSELFHQPPTSTKNRTAKAAEDKPFVPRGKPLTTQGKILKAQHKTRQAKKNLNPRSAPNGSENDVHAGSGVSPAMKVPQSAKKGKAGVEGMLGGAAGAHAEGRKGGGGGGKVVSLPPPGEMTQTALDERELKFRNAQAARRLASKKGSGWNNNKRKPITTQQKILAVKASGNLIKDGKGGGAVGKKGDRGRVGGLVGQLHRQSASAEYPVCESGEVKYVPFTARFVSAKTKRVKARVEQAEAEAAGGKKDVVLQPNGMLKKKGEKKKKAKPFRFLDLPDEVRNRIYRLSVVETKVCIWPDSATGREQPDISMVNRQVRDEVLPIFYGENTFAINVAPSQAPPTFKKAVVRRSGGVKTEEPLTGLSAVRAWALALSARRNEGGRWFGQISKWGFSYEDPDAGLDLSMEEVEDESKGFIVSIRPPELVEDEMEVALTSPLVEVHREAACFMPGWGECGKCICTRTPLRLNAAVIAWQASGEYRAEELSILATELRGMAEDLVEARCEKAGLE